jgi:hypothetical protein
MSDIDKCPKCGNENIISWATRQETRYYSKSGKCIKVDKARNGSVIMWGYKCKCGWESEVFTE